ncbi:unnamed protein product, partial [Polarella glacialis]
AGPRTAGGPRPSRAALPRVSAASRRTSSGSLDRLPPVVLLLSSALLLGLRSDRRHVARRRTAPTSQLCAVLSDRADQLASGSGGGTDFPQVTLFTKPGCTLCDKALEVLKSSSAPFELRTVNLDAPGNEDWRARYWCDIPVFHINGSFWAKHRLTGDEVEASLAEAARGDFQPRGGEPDSRGAPQEAEASEGCVGDCGGRCCEGDCGEECGGGSGHS